MQRLTANLAPAHVRKAGPSFDLAIAVALLAATGQIPRDALGRYAVCGELSLSGALRSVYGTLAIALGVKRCGYERLVVPTGNAAEAALVDGLEVVGVDDLRELVDLLQGRREPRPVIRPQPDLRADTPDLADVYGQADAKRALEIAAAGGHNLLMVGPPGAGKTMLARRLPGILPPPTFAEAVEITRVHSVAGVGNGRLASERPFRAPHHTISPSGLVGGGGGRPRPGEVTLAHRGVLFLDELGEFERRALEALRQPLESGEVEVTRGQLHVRFPAAVMLIAACNACPCGRAGDCRCRDVDRQRYHRRLSGPLLDRIDLICTLALPSRDELLEETRGSGEPSPAIRERVVAARERQAKRLAGTPALCNAGMDGPATRRIVRLGSADRRHLRFSDSGDLSGRAHDRVLRLARTIADLDGRERVSIDDLDEALAYKLTLPQLVAA
jgi:magnesium chelatase family protein